MTCLPGSRQLQPFLLLLCVAVSTPVHGQDAPPDAAPARDGWVATRMLSPGETLRTDDVQIRPITATVFGNLFNLDNSPVGMDVKHRILANRPVMERDVGRHALVRANTPVHIRWRSDSIVMDLQGRALQDGAAGDPVRAINPATSHTLQGVVLPDGSIQVGS